MKLALVGYGKMGREVEEAAKANNAEIVAIIDPTEPSATATEITAESLKDADVVVDFTTTEAVKDNVQKIAAAGKNMIVGTTGWYDNVDEIKAIVEQHDIGFLYSSNFSVGVNAFFKIVEAAAKVFNKLDMYDVFGYELYHNQKADSPSGTAKSMETLLLDNIQRKTKIAEEKLDRKIEPDELHFASVRAGSIPGTHIAGFDSEADTIELKHTARNRKGFATGAVLTAQWLADKKGFFTMDDFVKDFFA